MTVLRNVKDRLARIFETGGADELLTELERQAAAKEAAAEERRAAVARIDELLARRAERLPKLETAERAATEAHAAAVAVVKEKLRAKVTARTALSAERSSIDDELDRLRVTLARTCHPRVAAAIKRLDASFSDWGKHQERLVRWEIETVEVAPDRSDPLYGGMRAHGLKYRKKRFGSNHAAVAALREDLIVARKELMRLALVPSPTDADLERAEHLAGTADRFEAPAMTWTTPHPRRYDAEGVAIDEHGRRFNTGLDRK